MLTQLRTMSGVRHDDHEGAGCETIFPFWFRSTHGARQDGARRETIVLAWPQTTCGAPHDDLDGARYEMGASGLAADDAWCAP